MQESGLLVLDSRRGFDGSRRGRLWRSVEISALHEANIKDVLCSGNSLLAWSHGLGADGAAGFLAIFNDLEVGLDLVIDVGTTLASFLGCSLKPPSAWAGFWAYVSLRSMNVRESEGMVVLAVVAVGNPTITKEDNY
jgi:hypothetical protein